MSIKTEHSSTMSVGVADEIVIDPLHNPNFSIQYKQSGNRRLDARYHSTRILVDKFIENRLQDKNLSVKIITEELGLKRSTLYRLFSDSGVNEYIRNRRLDHARKVVINNIQGLTFAEIAKLWCFADGSHLARCFKKYYGVTPKNLATRTCDPE